MCGPHVALVIVVDDGSTDGTAARAEAAGATVVRHAENRGKGHAVRSGLASILSDSFTHVLLMDGDMQHLPDEAPRLLDAARSTDADLVVGERVFSRHAMPASRYYANRIGSRALSAFMGVRVADTQCGYRVFRTDIVRRMKLRATRLRHRDRDAREAGPSRRPDGARAGLRGLRRGEQAAPRARHDPHLFSRVVLSLPRTPLMSERTAQEPRRWTLHGLNNGWLFRTTVRTVTALPRPVSYAIAQAATWISWRLMTETTAAIADNLRAVFPDETERQLRRRALGTYRAYARDTIDFLRSISSTPEEAALIFDIPERTSTALEGLMAQGRGFILVCGHFGNWEIGSTLMHALRLPLTLVAMTEADDDVNRIRREIRDRLGADTLEVRQSLDTPLQIRRRLAENRAVALLMDRHMGRDRVRGAAPRTARLVPADAGRARAADGGAARALLHRAVRSRALPCRSRRPDLRGRGRRPRRGDRRGRPGICDAARAADPRPARTLVSLLSLLGRAAGRRARRRALTRGRRWIP